jgi:nucleoside-diphosphate-sugar epimerase
MRILLTGASGFIGQHIYPRLVQQGYLVDCLKSDLRDYDQVRQEVLASNPNIIVHLAARTEVEKSFYEPMDFNHVNYLGTVNLVNVASELPNLKNFFFASTMEVYGWQPISDSIRQGDIPEIIPAFDESTVPNPNAPYAVAKLACEKYLEYAHRSLGLPYCIIRQTNTYGRKDNNFFVVEQIISQMLADPNEIRLGYRAPYRNFLFINDLIDLWSMLIEKHDLLSGHDTFTIGPENAINIETLAGIIADKLSWNGEIVWNSKPRRPGEIYLLNSTHKRITEVLGWYPTTMLDQGLDITIDMLKRNVSR